MKRFRYVAISVFVFLIPVILLYCGGNPAEEGRAAFDRGDYMQAINLYTQAKADNPEQTQYDEMIALSWMSRGQQFYSRNKNIKVFAGNFEKGIGFLPEQVSPEFKIKYSELLYNFSKAYLEAKPANEIQAEQYHTKAIENLETACVMNDQNEDAWKLLEKIKEENFQKMFDKGKDYYTQARKSKSPNLWLLSEMFLTIAVDYNPDNAEAPKLLKKVRENTIRFPNTDPTYGDIGYGVAESQFIDNAFIVDIQIYNNLHQQSVQINPAKFFIADKDGNTYKHEASALGKFKDNELKSVELKAIKDVGGWLAFKISKKTKLDYLGYELNEEVTIKKYFP